MSLDHDHRPADPPRHHAGGGAARRLARRGGGGGARGGGAGAERLRTARHPPATMQANTGEPFPDRVARLMALARLANFLDGYAAVRPEVALTVAKLLDGGPLP